MGHWTNWRRIADHNYWYTDSLDYDGPACYQLSIAGPRGSNRKIVYVGETSNEMKRIKSYARDGSHLSKIIASHLKDGWNLWYRGRIADSKEEAVAMEETLLARNDYDWNLKLNIWGK